MGTMALPPGFRFHPTDDELVGYYLQRKVDGLTIELEVIPVIDLYKFDPWELPDKSFLPKRDMEWFFFCPRDKKYPNGSRTNRATASGYWKATGKDRKVLCESSAQGLRKTLVFYRGRAPGGERTDWVMHEYRLCEDLMQATPNFMGAFALCRVMKRNENGQKSGDLQGESRAKRSRPSAQSDFSPRKQSNNFSGSSERNPSEAASLFEICSDSTPITSPDENARGTEIHPIVIDTDQASFWDSNILSDPSKAFFSEEGIFSESIIPTQFLYSTESCPPCNLSPVSSYSSFTENGFLIDELNGGGCFTSFPSPLHCMDLYGNEDEMILQSFEWEMPRYMNPLLSGVEVCSTMSSPSICRQASDLEEGSLWRQEDSLVVVM